MKNLTTSFARAAMLLLLAVFTTTPAQAQEPDLGFITDVPTVDGGQASGWSDGALGHFVDGDLSTKYGVTNANPWIEFHYSSAITPKGYALWTAGDTEGRRNPKTWTIMAKNSGDANWTVLTTVDNSAGDKLPMANNTRTLFSLDNSTAYQYYRFEATRTTSGENANQFQLAELQFCTVSPAPYLQYARVTGLQSSYQYDDGNDIAIDYTVTALDGNVLTKGTHFTETIKNSSDETVTSVAAKGNYTLTITAIAPYYGSQTLNFSVIDGTDLSTITSNYTAQDGETLTGTLGSNVKISIADGATVTLRNATINGVNNSSYRWAGLSCLGNATIILEGNNSVKGFNESQSGIYVPQGKTLTIKGSGTLNASAHSKGCGISVAGSIIIESGIITATGGSFASGIGSPFYASYGESNIIIRGGTVTATGGSNGAGIGAGDSSTCGNITISGGTVTATGGDEAAGIGSGYSGTCGNITITTGVTSVIARKGNYTPNSIGAGSEGSCGTVTIGGVETGNIAQSPITYKPSENFNYTVAFNSNGGSGSMDNQQFLYGFAQNLRANTFTCIGRNFLGWSTTPDGEVAYTDGQSVTSITGATANSTVTLYAQWNHNIDLSTLTGNFTAIDGDVLYGTLGGNYKISIADGATVTLSGVTIYGTNSNSYQWAGITCLGDATIILKWGTTNTVEGFYKLYPGIYIPTNKTLTIKGSGSLTAYSNGTGAGIGGSTVDNGDCGNIVIEDGTVTATGRNNSAGIGGCGDLSCGNITIYGGTIYADGGKYGAGIGSGYQGTCGSITITGGTVTATGGDKAAGIGSGIRGTCGNITITTGVTSVTAKGNYAPNSIGAGHQGTCGTVSIGGVETGNITLSPFVTYPYTVAFNSNGGAGTMTNQILMYNVPQNLSDNTFTHTNGAYMGWNTQADGSGTALADGQNVSTLASTSGATVTLYAQWQGGELVDGTPYKATQDGSVSTATYTRPLTGRVGKHQAWFVPFDYEITSDDESKFSFYKINMIANSPTPSQGATDEMWVFLKPIGAGTVLHANMPYVFKPKEDMESYSFTTANTTLKAKDTEVLAKMETMEDIYEVYGIYENTSPSASDPFYYVNYYGEISLGNSSSVTVGPYRWIIRKTSKFGDTTSYAREMHFFDGEEDDATGLNEFDNFTNSQSDDCWYDLSGRIVKSSNSPSVKLPRGIYIHGGRKEAIR